MRSRDDSSVDAAWLAFVHEEANAVVPPELEQRVLARALRRPPLAPSRGLLRWRTPALAAVAAILAVTTTAVLWFAEEPSEPLAAQAAWDRASHLALRAPANFERSEAVGRAAAPLERRPRLPAVSRAVLAELPPPLLRFSPQPIGETEVLQIVRLRLPREVLQSLGVILVEPDAEGMVDVDVLVGEDGLARDIRQVSTGQE